MHGFTFWLLLFVRVALAGASWQAAPAPLADRPEVVAPAGGWLVEDGLYARVYGTPADQVTTRRLANHAAEAVPKLAKRLGIPAGGTMDIYVAPTQADFDRMQPGAPPEWADGTAWPMWGLVFLRAPEVRPGTADPLEQVLDHELVHVLIGRAFAPNTPPRWLQEGLAQFWTGELGPKTADDLSSVVFGRDKVFSLAELSGNFHGDPVRARLAYDASADFMGFVAGRYGEGSLRVLVREMARGAPFDEALQTATGDPSATVESAWRGRWSGAATWVKVFTSSGALWGVGAVLVVVGFVRVRRRSRRKLERWAQEEEWMRMRPPPGRLLH